MDNSLDNSLDISSSVEFQTPIFYKLGITDPFKRNVLSRALRDALAHILQGHFSQRLEIITPFKERRGERRKPFAIVKLDRVLS